MSLVSWFNRRAAPLITAIGITPRSVTLEVRGRASGKPIRLSVSPAELNGKKYLVSLDGERAWVKNVRAAHGEAFIIHGIRRRVLLREVPVDEETQSCSHTYSVTPLPGRPRGQLGSTSALKHRRCKTWRESPQDFRYLP